MLAQFIKQIKNNFYFLKYVYQFSRSYVIAEAMVALFQGIIPLLWVIMPKLIIDEITYGKEFSKFILVSCFWFKLVYIF